MYCHFYRNCCVPAIYWNALLRCHCSFYTMLFCFFLQNLATVAFHSARDTMIFIYSTLLIYWFGNILHTTSILSTSSWPRDSLVFIIYVDYFDLITFILLLIIVITVSSKDNPLQCRTPYPKKELQSGFKHFVVSNTFQICIYIFVVWRTDYPLPKITFH